METANYSILELLEYKNLSQFIVPEIQRDYVWEVNDVMDLLDSIKEGFEGSKKDMPYLGFIYAFTDRDFLYKYFLVDGQQRMTTIFLLIIACHLRIGKTLPDYIIKLEKLKLDYRVRQTTHDFLIDLVKYCQNNPNDLNFNIRDQAWFHMEYEIDRTITNMVKNFDAIRNWLYNLNQSLSRDFLKFIEDEVELSYFDIEDGRQGEDLYIYMNSRGRQLEINETLKAKYLTAIEDQIEKEKWGHIWEEWQDFFWSHKGDRPDADDGFNDFLKMVQIINMCALGKTANEISYFAGGRTDQTIDINLLPKSLNEVKKYFQSLEYVTHSERVINFFSQYEKNNDYFSASSSIDLRRKQIYYLRTLPIIAFLISIDDFDEKDLIRFIRFFYNVSRKESSVGKDISNQLPIAIKLMLEYGNNKKKDYDVCDLIDYQKGRTVLINEEEALKLSIFKTPPVNSTRTEIEELFWKAEDHFVFDGEINFLLNRYFNQKDGHPDIIGYKKTWEIFENIFTGTRETNAQISRALLYYGNTWIQNTPYYYLNYNCHDWHSLVRRNTGKYLIQLLEDLHGKTYAHLDIIIKDKVKEYFVNNNLRTIAEIKSQNDPYEQVKILVGLDYYSDKIIWNYYSFIAFDDRFTYTGDQPFFVNDHRIFNVLRYVGDGWQGRVIPLMKNILQDETKLRKLLEEIVKS